MITTQGLRVQLSVYLCRGSHRLRVCVVGTCPEIVLLVVAIVDFRCIWTLDTNTNSQFPWLAVLPLFLNQTLSINRNTGNKLYIILRYNQPPRFKKKNGDSKPLGWSLGCAKALLRHTICFKLKGHNTVRNEITWCFSLEFLLCYNTCPWCTTAGCYTWLLLEV